MSDLGTISSDTDMNTEESAPIVNNNDEMTTPVSTTSATLADVTGATMTITTPRQGRIMVWADIQCSSSGGGSALGGWVIDIDGTDSTEMQRQLSGGTDTGSASLNCRSASKAANTYTIKVEHRRVSGSATVNTDKVFLSAIFVAD